MYMRASGFGSELKVVIHSRSLKDEFRLARELRVINDALVACYGAMTSSGGCELYRVTALLESADFVIKQLKGKRYE